MAPTAKWLTYTTSRSYSPCHSHLLPCTASLLSLCLIMLGNSSSRLQSRSESGHKWLPWPTTPPAFMEDEFGPPCLNFLLDFHFLYCLKVLSFILHTQSLNTLIPLYSLLLIIVYIILISHLRLTQLVLISWNIYFQTSKEVLFWIVKLW